MKIIAVLLSVLMGPSLAWGRSGYQAPHERHGVSRQDYKSIDSISNRISKNGDFNGAKRYKQLSIHAAKVKSRGDLYSKRQAVAKANQAENSIIRHKLGNGYVHRNNGGSEKQFAVRWDNLTVSAKKKVLAALQTQSKKGGLEGAKADMAIESITEMGYNAYLKMDISETTDAKGKLQYNVSSVFMDSNILGKSEFRQEVKNDGKTFTAGRAEHAVALNYEVAAVQTVKQNASKDGLSLGKNNPIFVTENSVDTNLTTGQQIGVRGAGQTASGISRPQLKKAERKQPELSQVTVSYSRTSEGNLKAPTPTRIQMGPRAVEANQQTIEFLKTDPGNTVTTQRDGSVVIENPNGIQVGDGIADLARNYAQDNLGLKPGTFTVSTKLNKNKDGKPQVVAVITPLAIADKSGARVVQVPVKGGGKVGIDISKTPNGVQFEVTSVNNGGKLEAKLAQVKIAKAVLQDPKNFAAVAQVVTSAKNGKTNKKIKADYKAYLTSGVKGRAGAVTNQTSRVPGSYFTLNTNKNGRTRIADVKVIAPQPTKDSTTAKVRQLDKLLNGVR